MSTESTRSEVTQLLRQARSGDDGARSLVVNLIHGELHDIAHRQMRNERGLTLQATGLVNEAYLELFGKQAGAWEDRNHFFAYAATVMRHILVREARRRQAKKRGGDQLRVTLEGLPAEQREEDLLALDAALDVLTELDPRKGRIVEMRYFGGLTIDEVCAVENLSPATIHKDLKAARGWLYAELNR